MITVLADQNHYQLHRYLHPSVRLVTYDPITGWNDSQLREADALLVRTTSPVRQGDIPGDCKLRFIGTASAGRDHLDDDWLASGNIYVADAKGSNAACVAEYVAVAVLYYLEVTGTIDKTTGYPASGDLVAGVVGAGCTGTAVANILESIGIRCLRYDPPREEREKQHQKHALQSNKNTPVSQPLPSGDTIELFRSVSLDEILSCDILSFHVPLEQSGKDATWHWYDKEKIAAGPKKLVINASRGGVVDETELRKAHREHHIDKYVCDVWENEPVFKNETAQPALIATPHIAGYSVEAKREATRMMCKQLHSFFNIPEPEIPDTPPKQVRLPNQNLSLSEIIRILHPVFYYDRSLRSISGLPDPEKGTAFLKLRQDIPLRHEFHQLALPGSIMDRYPVLNRIGIVTGDEMKQEQSTSGQINKSMQ